MSLILFLSCIFFAPSSFILRFTHRPMQKLFKIALLSVKWFKCHREIGRRCRIDNDAFQNLNDVLRNFVKNKETTAISNF